MMEQERSMKALSWSLLLLTVHAAPAAAQGAVSEFMGSADTRKYMESDYAQIKAFLVDLDLAK